MPVTIEPPAEMAHRLEQKWGGLQRRAHEAVALEGYRSRALGAGQVAELLGLRARETEALLRGHGADPDYTARDLDEDVGAGTRVLTR